MNQAHKTKKKKQAFGTASLDLPFEKLTPQALNDLRRYTRPGDVLEFIVNEDFTLTFQLKRGNKVARLPISMFPGLASEVHAWVGGLVQPVDEPVDYSEKHAETRKAINRKHSLLAAEADGVRLNLLLTEAKPSIEVRNLTRYWVYQLNGFKAYTTVGNKEELWFIVSDDEPGVEKWMPKADEELVTTKVKPS